VAELTPFQTLGPFFHRALCFAGGERLATADSQGRQIVLEGSVRDGSGSIVPDALIEIWQANSFGRYDHPEDPGTRPTDAAFDGFGRVATNADGWFIFETIKPGPVPGPGGRAQAPHVLVGVLARGLLTRLVTRAYFDDEETNAADPVLARVPAERRGTLIARSAGPGRYRFDIVLQGENETVFFDL
jgi:protocatechuate 3,4-dioxygenase alpha subunit